MKRTTIQIVLDRSTHTAEKKTEGLVIPVGLMRRLSRGQRRDAEILLRHVFDIVPSGDLRRSFLLQLLAQ